MDRTKLDSVIEKDVHKLIFEIKEHVYDFTHLYLRRNKIEIDQQVVETILKVVQLAIQEGELSKIGSFHERIKKTLDEYTGEENPNEHLGVPAPTPQAVATPVGRGRPKKVAFSL